MLPGCSGQKWQVKLSLFPPPQAPLQKELPGMTGSACCRNSQSYRREVAVINATLKRRQAAVLCRNLSQLQRGGSEFGCLHRCVSAVCPVPGASPALAGTAAPCSDGHRCLLPPRSTSRGGSSLSLFQNCSDCSFLQPEGILSQWPFCASLTSKYMSCLCLCHTETVEEFLMNISSATE